MTFIQIGQFDIYHGKKYKLDLFHTILQCDYAHSNPLKSYCHILGIIAQHSIETYELHSASQPSM